MSNREDNPPKRDTTRRALAKTFSAQYATTIIFALSSILVARLLTPEEVGIFSVAAAMLAFGHMLRDFGTGQYVIQEENLTTERLRAALAVTLGIGWTLAVSIFLLAPYLADSYEEPGISRVLRVMALNFALLPFGTVSLAYLRREMQFGPAALSGTLGGLFQSLVTIYLAYSGFGYMSLAWGALAGTAASILVAVYYRPTAIPWCPGFHGIGRVLSFGSKLSTVWVVSEVGRIIPELILGKVVGFTQVGMYSRAQGLNQLFSRLVTAGVGPVVSSTIAEASRDGRSVRHLFVYVTLMVCGLGWAFYAVLFVLAEPITLVLFGDQWLPAVPLIKAWSVASALAQLTSMVNRVMVAAGRIGPFFRASLLIQLIRVLIVSVAAFYGVLELVLSLILVQLFSVGILLWVCVKELHLRWSDYRYIIWKSACPALCAVVVTAIVYSLVCEAGASFFAMVGVLILSGGSGGLIWALAAILVKHPLLAELVNAMRREPPMGIAAISIAE